MLGGFATECVAGEGFVVTTTVKLRKKDNCIHECKSKTFQISYTCLFTLFLAEV